MPLSLSHMSQKRGSQSRILPHPLTPKPSSRPLTLPSSSSSLAFQIYGEHISFYTHGLCSGHPIRPLSLSLFWLPLLHLPSASNPSSDLLSVSFLNSKSDWNTLFLNTLHGLPKCPDLLCQAISISPSSTSFSWWSLWQTRLYPPALPT